MTDNTIEIKKSTGITVSIAILVSLIVFGFSVGSWATGVAAQVETNTRDIEATSPQIIELNKNLVETNQNVIRLQVQLEQVMKGLE